MCRGKCGNLGNIGNDESVTCRPHYPGDGTNPPLSASPFCLLGYGQMSRPVPISVPEEFLDKIRPDVFDHLRNLLPCALPCQAPRAGSTASTQHGGRVTRSELISTGCEGRAPPW